MKIYSILPAMCVLAILIVAGCTQAPENTIDVQGTFEQNYRPNEAEVRTGISVVKATAGEAQSSVNQIVNAVTNGLQAVGIPEADIQTEQLSLSEERTYTETGGSQLVGWRATQMLKIKTSDLAKVGPIVDASTRNGANQISSINFKLSRAKEDEYRQLALAEATKNAKAKAETIAQSLGVRLGTVKKASEGTFNYIPYIYPMKAMEGAAAVVEAASVTPLDVTITATVALTYSVQ